MDKKQFQKLKETISQINSIVKSVDPVIKTQVFELLKPMIDAVPGDPAGDGEGRKEKRAQQHSDPKNVRAFYTSHNPDKPAKRVRIMAAWFYSQRGTNPFTLSELEELFDDVGVGHPGRLDMTLKQAREKGHHLFHTTERGKYRPTVHGENYFKDKLGVRPPRS